MAIEDQRQSGATQPAGDALPPGAGKSNGALPGDPTDAEQPVLGQSALQEAVTAETGAAFAALQRNAKLNFLVRASLYLTGWLAVVLAGWYTIHRGDDMVGVLLSSGRSGSTLDTARIVALTLPDILLVILASACFVAALLIQTRGIDDFEGGLDGISRLRREADVGVSRSRTSVHALEEYLGNAKRAFRLQLWLSRTLFVVCLILFGVAVGSGIVSGVDWATAALGAGSVLTLLLGTLSGLPSKVGVHLADATQIQTVVVAATRRINVLEEHLYQLMEAHRRRPETIGAALASGSREIGLVAHEAVAEIQRYAEPLNDSAQQDQH